MSNNKRNKRPQSGSHLKLEEFPDDFDDLFFHNQTIESQNKIAILRSIVYKTIKSKVLEKIKEYQNDDIPLEDNFDVSFKTDGFTDFQWAVVREELLYCGYDVQNTFDENNKLKEITVPIKRKISLTKTLKEKLQEDYENSDLDSDSEN